MGVRLALLSSPLLGPSGWRSVAEQLSSREWTVAILSAPRRERLTPDDVLRSFLDGLSADEDVVLVPHSNAGLFVPAITTARPVAGYVFVDAAMPAEYGRVPLCPPALREFLNEKVDRDGLLPPWTQWWDAADVAPLFPDAEVREQVEREQPRLALSYFDDSLPVPPGWDDRPGAYLAFGDTYSTERSQSADRGWPVATVHGHHLQQLVDPPAVAATIDELLHTIGFQPT